MRHGIILGHPECIVHAHHRESEVLAGKPQLREDFGGEALQLLPRGWMGTAKGLGGLPRALPNRQAYLIYLRHVLD